jgi:hypothetical protein
MSVLTWGDVLTDALIEIGAYGPEDPVDASAMQTVVIRANRMLDSWSALQRYAYSVSFPVFQAFGSHAPILIGPTVNPAVGDFVWPTKPVRIESAAQLLNSSSSVVDLPINIRDRSWWATQQTKYITSGVMTDLYYEPGDQTGLIPSATYGTINPWPVLNVGAQLRLQLWTVIQAIPLDSNGNPDLTSEFIAPQGYQAAFTLTLAETICTAFGRPVPPALPGLAHDARGAIFSNNIKSPRVASADWGTRGGRGRSSNGTTFNWASGLPGT